MPTRQKSHYESGSPQYQEIEKANKINSIANHNHPNASEAQKPEPHPNANQKLIKLCKA